MDGIRRKEDGKQILLTALSALGIFFVLFLIRDLWPVGKGSILMIDLHTQYVPLLYRFYDVVTGKKNLFLDLSVAAGMNLYGDTVNEMIDPFNYLLLFFGRDRIYLAVNLLLACYGVAASSCACALLQRLWPGKRKYNLILSLSYAFSGYMAYQFQIIRWLYLPVLFPVYLLALLRTLRKNRWGAYALLVGYQLALSLQLGVMTLLFTLFGSGFWFWAKREGTREAPASCAGLAAGTVTGVLLSCPVLLPQIGLLLHSARAGENLSYLSVMRRHGLDDLFERLFQVYQPVTAAMTVYFWIRIRRRHGAEKGGTGKKRFWKTLPRDGKALLSWNLFLWLTVIAQPSNLLWHLGSYMCFPVRYAYMVLFSGILLVKWMAVRVEEGGTASVPQGPDVAGEGMGTGSRRLAAVSALGAVCLVAAAVWGSITHGDEITQAFSSLAISLTCPDVAVRVAFLLLLLSLGCLSALCAGRAQRPLAVAAACGTGVCFYLFLLLPQDYGVRALNEAAYARMNQEYGDGENSPTGFLRVEEDPELPLNAPLVRGGSSMAGYFPSGCEKRYAGTMERLGYLTPWVSVRSVGGTEISDGLFGIKRPGTVIFPNGVRLPDTAEEIDALYEKACAQGPLSAQACLGELLTGEERMERVSWDGLPVDGKGYRVLRLREECRLYLDADREAGLLSVWINGREMEFAEGDSWESPHRLLDLGTYPEGDVRILVTERGGQPLPGTGMELGLLAVNPWRAAVEEVLKGGGRGRPLLDGQVRLRERAGEIAVSLGETGSAGTLFLPVAACEGWRVYVDGGRQEPERLLDGFLGVSLSGGEREIVFRFVPPGWEAGLMLAGLGSLFLGISMGLDRHGGKRRPSGKTVHRIFLLYRLVLAMGVVGIYVVPNAGLALYMCQKALGRFL